MISGCATSGGKNALYAGSRGVGIRGLSDEDAVRTVRTLNGAKPETREDVVAKNITLGEYIAELRKRESPCLEESGVFGIRYTREDLRQWTGDELDSMYKALDAGMVVFKGVNISELDDEEKSLRVIRMTARDAVIRERRRRDLSRGLVEMFCNSVIVAVKFVVPI